MVTLSVVFLAVYVTASGVECFTVNVTTPLASLAPLDAEITDDLPP